jgi:hypothetical protein
MEALQMLKYSYDHGGEELNFVADLDRVKEISYVLDLDKEQTCAPKDINLYIESLTTTTSVTSY